MARQHSWARTQQRGGRSALPIHGCAVGALPTEWDLRQRSQGLAVVGPGPARLLQDLVLQLRELFLGRENHARVLLQRLELFPAGRTSVNNTRNERAGVDLKLKEVEVLRGGCFEPPVGSFALRLTTAFSDVLQAHVDELLFQHFKAPLSRGTSDFPKPFLVDRAAILGLSNTEAAKAAGHSHCASHP